MGKKKYDFDSINFEELIDYYNSHSRLETAKHYNLSEIALKRYLKSKGYKKDKKFVLETYKKSMLNKYGVEFPIQTQKYKDNFDKILEKRFNTLEARYGSRSYNNQDKIKQTCLERYGVENYFASDENKQKLNSDDVKRRRVITYKNTCIQKYGVDSYTKTDEFFKKYKSTCKEKYGVEYYFLTKDCIKAAHTEESYEKRKKTSNEKYGADWYTQTLEYHQKARKLYSCDNYTFDSLPELAFYIWAKANNKLILRSPCEYKFTFNGVEKSYFPDFSCDGELIEIKGDHFFKEDGTMCNPYDHSQDELYEAKHQCGLRNGVQFWRSDKYSEYVDYFKEHYNEQDFIINKNTI